jgi:hypothetical protein
MKLFQRLLVAPAALGFLAPISANATEVNLKDITNYSDVDSIEFANSFNVEESTETNLIAGGEGLVDFGGDFSETTTATFSADFAIGAVDGNGTTSSVTDGDEAISAVYGFQIDLNTSFTGDDSFDVSIDAGNGGNALTELDLNNTSSDELVVDGISYTFPVGDNLTVLVGNDVAGSSLYNTACVYGGITDTLDDCGNANSAMDVDSDASGGNAALSASYDFGDGFTAAFGYEGGGDGTVGLMTKEGSDTYGLQLSYEEEDGQFGASLTYANYDTSSTDTTYWGLNGYWTPEDVGAVPSISVGYEVGNPSENNTDTSHYFVGFQWDEIGDGTLGAAFGTTGHIADDTADTLIYEAFYSYPINDGMTVTPVIYVKENSGSTSDETGVIVKTSFSF